MNVKEILGLSLRKMGLKDYIDSDYVSASELATLDKLLSALNIIYTEVLTEYLPLSYTETVSAENGVVSLSALSKRIIYPTALVRDGVNIPFRTYPDSLTCDFSGDAELTYTYLPSSGLGLNDSVTDSRLTAGVLSDGTLGEYYFQNRVFDLAASFDSDFRASLNKLKYKGNRLRLPERRWEA